MLRHRLVSGIILALLMIAAALYAPPLVALAVLALLSCFGQLEFYRMANQAGIPVFRVIGLGSGAALIGATFLTTGPDAVHHAQAYKWEQLVLVGSLIACLVRQFPQKDNDKPLQTIALTLLGIWYVPYLLNFITRLAFEWDGTLSGWGLGAVGRRMVIYLVLVVKITDAGAYFAGRFLGRHKLFPRLSPKKTWEGAVGGVAAAAVASVIFVKAGGGQLGGMPMALGHAVALGVVLGVVGTVGDLFESLVKRAAQVKDSGTLFPGMGGLLDVLDSLLFGAPAMYVYLRLFVQPGVCGP